MPWVLSNFVSTSVPDLSDERNYRDLTKPMGALDPERLNKSLEKYASLCSVDYAIPPFMYGSHYSNTGGVVLHYLVRMLRSKKAIETALKKNRNVIQY